MRNGNLLIFVDNSAIAEKFISAKELHGICKIQCQYHKNLNHCKGTITLTMLQTTKLSKSSSRRELLKYVCKYTKQLDGKVVPTVVVQLTFNLYSLPQKIQISWHLARVKEYIPNPMRCKNCQILGHS